LPRQKSQNLSVIYGDLLDIKTLRIFVEAGCIVVNLAYLNGCSEEKNLAAVYNLMEIAAQAKIRRLIHCSTAVVSGRVNINWVTENTRKDTLKNTKSSRAR
jgi:nucleoside-diphosphate-sugar epimerase